MNDFPARPLHPPLRLVVESLMPGALVDRLSREDLRDLFRYLFGLGKER